MAREYSAGCRDALRERQDLDFAAVMPSLRSEAGAGLSIEACSWFSTYRIHHRAAARFRDRRCFLLGDAAHVHSPVGAQGMNTGLQDAYNLAWKLALVVRGEADAALLDTYEEERIPVAQRLLRTTDRAFQVIVAGGWFGRLFRTRILARVAAFAMTRETVRRVAFRTISQIGIRYRASRLSQTHAGLPDGAPAAGDRFPWLKLRLRANGPVEDLYQRLDDTRYNLLVIGQPAPAAESLALGDLVSIHEVADDPVNAEALTLSLRGWSLLAQGKPDADVDEVLERATALEPRLVTSQLRLAGAAENRNDYDKAIARYRAVLAAEPGNVVALNNLAYALADKKGLAAEALPLAERAYRLSGQAPTIADTLAWVHFKLADVAKALPLLDQAAKSAPANVDILVHAAIVHASVGNLVQSRRYVDAAIKADPKAADRSDVKALIGKLVIE